MAGTVLERELTAAHAPASRFGVATSADDADIRRLLRENPMSGKISLSLEREPNFFADEAIPGEERRTILCRCGEKAVGFGSCTIRRRFVNGEPRRVGYLNALRLAGTHAGRFDLLRRGYAMFHELQKESPADYYFTSIAADNQPARRFLERRLRGMPRYELVGEFATMLVPTCRTSANAAKPGLTVVGQPAFVNQVNQAYRDYQLAPYWSLEELAALESLGLHKKDVFASAAGGAACAALWDQRSFKQTVIRDYSPAVKRLRPLLNCLSRLPGLPALPPVGTVLPYAVVSHLAASVGDLGQLLELVAGLRSEAARRGISFLLLGFATNDPRLLLIRRQFRCREYRSRIYMVTWPDLGSTAQELDGRILQPELALL